MSWWKVVGVGASVTDGVRIDFFAVGKDDVNGPCELCLGGVDGQADLVEDSTDGRVLETGEVVKGLREVVDCGDGVLEVVLGLYNGVHYGFLATDVDVVANVGR